jgi:glycosyltransferase involved in cell wall biosynthesis
LGTPVVSFDVGIASELLQGELAVLISSRNLQEFSEKVTFVLENNEELSEKISVASGAYVRRILEDFECLTMDEVGVGSWRHQRHARSLVNILKWKLRWMRYLRSREVAK